jgi:hypothetical protein
VPDEEGLQQIALTVGLYDMYGSLCTFGYQLLRVALKTINGRRITDVKILFSLSIFMIDRSQLKTSPEISCCRRAGQHEWTRMAGCTMRTTLDEQPHGTTPHCRLDGSWSLLTSLLIDHTSSTTTQGLLHGTTLDRLKAQMRTYLPTTVALQQVISECRYRILLI